MHAFKAIRLCLISKNTQHGLNSGQRHKDREKLPPHVKPSIQERKRTGVMLWAARQHMPSAINLHNRPLLRSPSPLSRFRGWGRCQLGGWWWRAGHTISHLALLAIYVVKSSEAPAAHPTDGFLDWLESSEHFLRPSLALRLKSSMWKLKKC